MHSPTSRKSIIAPCHTILINGCYLCSLKYLYIAMTSHKRHGVLNYWQFNCLFNSWFRKWINHQNAEHYWPFVTGHLRVIGGLHSQGAHTAQNASMLWRHWGKEELSNNKDINGSPISHHAPKSWLNIFQHDMNAFSLIHVQQSYPSWVNMVVAFTRCILRTWTSTSAMMLASHFAHWGSSHIMWSQDAIQSIMG